MSRRRGSCGGAWRSLLVVAAACGSPPSVPHDGAPACLCGDEVLPEGFYRYVERRDDRTREEILQLVRDPGSDVGELVFGFYYRNAFYSVGPIRGSLEDGCHFTATHVFDMLVTSYDGHRECEDNTLAGTARSVASGFEETWEFELEPTARPWMIGDGTYRLYGSSSVDLAGKGYTSIASGTCGTYAPTNFVELSADDWSLIGDGTASASFSFAPAHSSLLLTWPVDTQLRFDAIVDEVSSSPLSASIEDESCGPSQVVNFVAYSNQDPAALAGWPEGAGFSGEPGLAGFIALTFPDNQSAPALSPETGKALVRVHVLD